MWWGWQSLSLPAPLRFLLRAVAVFGLLLGVLVAVRYVFYLRARRQRRAQRLQRQRELLASASASSTAFPASFPVTPGCPNCGLHAQQLQLLRRLHALIALRLSRLQSSCAWAELQARKQRLLTSSTVAFTESEASVVALAEELEAAWGQLGKRSEADEEKVDSGQRSARAASA